MKKYLPSRRFYEYSRPPPFLQLQLASYAPVQNTSLIFYHNKAFQMSDTTICKLLIVSPQGQLSYMVIMQYNFDQSEAELTPRQMALGTRLRQENILQTNLTLD